MNARDDPPPRWLMLLGIGEDGAAGLTQEARDRIARAALVVGGARHLALAGPLIRGETLAWPQPMSDAYPAILARRPAPVVVLASGDPNWFGVAEALRRLVPVDETTCLPVPSSFSLACAHLGWSLQDVATVSFCGRPVAALRPMLQPGARILALSADAGTPGEVAALLARLGFGGSRLHILEALGGPRARHRATTPGEMPNDVDPLNLIGIEVVAGPDTTLIPSAPGLPDEWFEHDGQITKREIRAITIAALAPSAGALLWDIGCGSGSVGIEWSLSHPAARAIGVEPKPERVARALRNASALGVPSLRIVTGAAPEALVDLPPPDAVFIGGGAQTAGVIDAAWSALRPAGRCVINAVTVETELLLFAAQEARGGTLTRMQIDRLDNVGRMRAFRPSMTVTQWAATKR